MAKTATKKGQEVDLTLPNDIETKLVDLADIRSNTAQSRGMGVFKKLNATGYGLFEPLKGHKDKSPLWDMLLSSKAEVRLKAVELVESYEDEILKLAKSIDRSGQLQPIGVCKLADGLDVIFGMRRCLAVAYLSAKDETAPTKIEARVIDGEFTPTELRLLAIQENEDREDESPLDKAITYKRLIKEDKLTVEQVADHIRMSSQTVKNYLLLLEPELEDKREAIHSGDLKVEPALKILADRKAGGNGAATRTGKGEGERYRFPTVMKAAKFYETGAAKPDKMSEEEWDLWHDPMVKQLMHYLIGLPASGVMPSESAAEPAKPAKEEQTPASKPPTNGKPRKPKAGDGAMMPGAVEVFQVKRTQGVKLLTALGIEDASSLNDEDLAAKLQSVPSLVNDDDEPLADGELEKLLGKLIDGFKDGVQVSIQKGGRK